MWALVIKRANEARQKESSNAISGPEYYGFSNPVVIEMIEELEEQLVGKKHELAEIESVLASNDLTNYFGKVTLEEILALFK